MTYICGKFHYLVFCVAISYPPPPRAPPDAWQAGEAVSGPAAAG